MKACLVHGFGAPTWLAGVSALLISMTTWAAVPVVKTVPWVSTRTGGL